MTIFSDNEELQGFRISFVETSKDKVDIIEQALLSLETCKSPKEFKDILRKLFAEDWRGYLKENKSW